MEIISPQAGKPRDSASPWSDGVSGLLAAARFIRISESDLLFPKHFNHPEAVPETTMEPRLMFGWFPGPSISIHQLNSEDKKLVGC